jgi:hypothetical protein
MSSSHEHPPEPGPEAFEQVRQLLSDLAVQIAAIPDELVNERFDSSIHASIVNWTVYCLALIGDHCAAAANLTEPRHVRVLCGLARTVYEYCIALLYVDRHPEIARMQFKTFYGRSLRRIVEMQPYNTEAQAEFEEWNADARNNKANSYSGNFNNKTAIMEVEGPHKNGVSAYGLFYAEMSVFAHPDAAGYSDIFYFDFDDGNLSVHFRSGSSYHAFDALSMIVMHTVRALRAATLQLKLSAIDIDAFVQRKRDVMALHFNRG